MLFLNLFLQHKRLELKIRELESKLELEKTTKGRLDTQIVRSKEGSEKMIKEIEDIRLKESNCQEDMKKLSRVVRWANYKVLYNNTP